MEYIIHYENFSSGDGSFKRGDYVKCYCDGRGWEKRPELDRHSLNTFLSGNVGKIVAIYNGAGKDYLISYDNIPAKLANFFNKKSKRYGGYCRFFSDTEILDWASTKKELELKISTDRFDL